MAQKTPVSNLTLNASGTWTSLCFLDYESLRRAFRASLLAQNVAHGFYYAKQRVLKLFSLLQSNATFFGNASAMHIEVSRPKTFQKRIKVTELDAHYKRLQKQKQVVTALRVQIRLQRSLKLSAPRFKFWSRRRPQTGPVLMGRRTLPLRAVAFLHARFSNYRAHQGTRLWSTPGRWTYRPRPQYVWQYRVSLKYTGRRPLSTTAAVSSVTVKARTGVRRPRTALGQLAVRALFQLRRRRTLAQRRRRTAALPVAAPFAAPGYRQAAGLALYAAMLQTNQPGSGTLASWWAPEAPLLFPPFRSRRFKKQVRGLLRLHKRLFYFFKHQRRRGLKPTTLKQALRHVLGFPTRIGCRKYVTQPGLLDTLRHVARFRRWQTARYFTATVMALLHSLMQGSAVLMANWLSLLLTRSPKHSSILYLVEAAGQFLLEDPDSPGFITPHIPSQGFKLHVCGKVDGREMADTFKAQAGAIPTSTLGAGLSHEFAPTHTIYGVLGIHFWLYVKAVFPMYPLGGPEVYAVATPVPPTVTLMRTRGLRRVQLWSALPKTKPGPRKVKGALSATPAPWAELG
jgi:hypothetical protein